MKRISKAVLESKNACDEKVTIDLSHVEYIKEGKLAISGTVGTMIYFTSGNKIFDPIYTLNTIMRNIIFRLRGEQHG